LGRWIRNTGRRARGDLSMMSTNMRTRAAKAVLVASTALALCLATG
jgi:hypothetical protein